MSTLLILLQARERLPAPAGSNASGATEFTDFDWVLLPANGTAPTQGRCAAQALPAAQQLVLVPADLQTAFHRTPLPRTAPGRWRAALVGLLEEQLLQDPEELHLALQPQAAGGQEVWVCVTPRAPLAAALAELDAAQRFVDRIAPLHWPADSVRGHVSLDEHGTPVLRWQHPDGVGCLPLRGSFARERLAPLLQNGHWTAQAEVADEAQRLLGVNVQVQSAAEHSAQALLSPWNLRQFELAGRPQGWRWLQQLGHRLMQPEWRMARFGVAALLGLQLVGLNALAWQQRQQLSERRLAVEQTLTTAFPQVRAVLDAPVQMQRELARLRAAAGRPDDSDLDPMLAALAAAWPADRAPLDALSYEPGLLSFGASDWSEPHLEQLRQSLGAAWTLQPDQGRMTLRRSKAPAP
ncbi:general secretion pathway protein L [Inhella inkyongensis]|uniref:General secretion pathway protein L n=1 Tax=Inhella inkyongensis TaxID=392593 RepID=A0A840S2F9_9BURK|nr:type II secretion system protein GspL [Inhella inkyongensis]MBB5203276.1 general secretion pathway protein L [Inhella inkyongensis]